MSRKSENNEQLESFFRKEYQVMKGYIRSRIRATTDRDADDILQDVALKMFSGANLKLPINNVGGFVYRSIRNRIIDLMRKKDREIHSEQEVGNQLLRITDTVGSNPYSEELKTELEMAIQRLKPHYREIIIAVDIEGYSYKEISEETGIPEGTLMSRRHRAIAQLYNELEKKIQY